jgi:hypothetical protein
MKRIGGGIVHLAGEIFAGNVKKRCGPHQTGNALRRRDFFGFPRAGFEPPPAFTSG